MIDSGRNKMDYDTMTIAEIKQAILDGKTTNDEVTEYYANEWWDELGAEPPMTILGLPIK
jgi:hypothetical protein